MNGSFGDPALFLVRTLFELVIFVLITRYFLQLFRANFFNPVTQAIVRITDPVLRPLRKILPRTGRHDLASLIVATIFLVLMVIVLGQMQGVSFGVGAVLISVVYLGFITVTNLFFWTILLRAVASWLGPNRSPGVAFLEDLTDPILQPVQRILPPLGGIDLSPLAVLLAIQVVQMLVGNWLMG